MVIILIVIRASRVYIHVKTHQITNFKYVRFNVLQLYVNKAIKWQNNKMAITVVFISNYLFNNNLISINEGDISLPSRKFEWDK